MMRDGIYGRPMYGAPMPILAGDHRPLTEVLLVSVGDNRLPVLACLRRMLGKSLGETQRMVQACDAGEDVVILLGDRHSIRDNEFLNELKQLGAKLDEREEKKIHIDK
jgi:hypothetical protein